MKRERVWAVYFSATDTTKKTVCRIADRVAGITGMERKEFDFTLPEARKEAVVFGEEDLLIFGTPVIAGRVPNVLLKYLATIQGNGALAVPVVSYGNRNYDDALIELRDILEKAGCHTIAGAAFVGEHSFSRTLAAGRPDEADFAVADAFAEKIADKLSAIGSADTLTPIEVKGIPYPYRGYYQPRDRKGNPVDIRKVKPKTNDNCDDCKLCARICPLGSISFDNVREFTGICMKCCACIKKCPKQAKYYDDERYLYHQHELEEGYTRRAEPELFV